VRDSCPRCMGGQLAQDCDFDGHYIYCLQCGYQRIPNDSISEAISKLIYMPYRSPIMEGHLPPKIMHLIDAIPLQTTSEIEKGDRSALAVLQYKGTADYYPDAQRRANKSFFIRHGYHKWALAHPNLSNSPYGTAPSRET
jgi:hypothetical protein